MCITMDDIVKIPKNIAKRMMIRNVAVFIFVSYPPLLSIFLSRFNDTKSNSFEIAALRAKQTFN